MANSVQETRRCTGYVADKVRLARGPQEASWVSNQIIMMISISRWDSANNNIYKVISILTNCHFRRASRWARIAPSQERCFCESFYLQLAFGLTHASNTVLAMPAYTHSCTCQRIRFLKRLQASLSVGS